MTDDYHIIHATQNRPSLSRFGEKQGRCNCSCSHQHRWITPCALKPGHPLDSLTHRFQAQALSEPLLRVPFSRRLTQLTHLTLISLIMRLKASQICQHHVEPEIILNLVVIMIAVSAAMILLPLIIMTYLHMTMIWPGTKLTTSMRINIVTLMEMDLVIFHDIVNIMISCRMPMIVVTALVLNLVANRSPTELPCNQSHWWKWTHQIWQRNVYHNIQSTQRVQRVS